MIQDQRELRLRDIVRAVSPLDETAMAAARKRQSLLTKPRGSLGKLEDVSIRVAGITGKMPPEVGRAVVVLMAADHGVVEEGVSAYPAEVTAQMVTNFLHGGAAINVLTRNAGISLRTVDMGIASDIPPHEHLEVRKVGYGTKNLSREAAMSRAQATESVLIGAAIAEEEAERGADLVATGDMGIGNTTPAAAIAAALTGLAVEDVTGRGTGIDDKGLQRKASMIQRALAVNRPDPQDGLDVLSKVGGFEIGGLTGLILGAAARRLPIVLDGYISTAAAMLAVSMVQDVRNYLIAGHVSAEHGHRAMLDWLHLEPLLSLNMRLGEGSGAALAVSLVRAACQVLAEMSSFDEAGVSERRG